MRGRRPQLFDVWFAECAGMTTVVQRGSEASRRRARETINAGQEEEKHGEDCSPGRVGEAAMRGWKACSAWAGVRGLAWDWQQQRGG